MARMELFLKDGQRLGWIKLCESGHVAYGVSYKEASDIPLEQALVRARRISDSYRIIIHEKKNNEPPEKIRVRYDL